MNGSFFVTTCVVALLMLPSCASLTSHEAGPSASGEHPSGNLGNYKELGAYWKSECPERADNVVAPEIDRKQTDAELTFLGFVVGQSKLDEVQARIGGTVLHSGDAGGSENVLCYDVGDGALIAFESNEVGGEEHVITRAGFYDANTCYDYRPHCGKARLRKDTLQAAGLRLGMTALEVHKLHSEPNAKVEDVVFYHYNVTEKIEKQDVNIFSSLEVTLHGDRVSGVTLSKLETL